MDNKKISISHSLARLSLTNHFSLMSLIAARREIPLGCAAGPRTREKQAIVINGRLRRLSFDWTQLSPFTEKTWIEFRAQLQVPLSLVHGYPEFIHSCPTFSWMNFLPIQGTGAGRQIGRTVSISRLSYFPFWLFSPLTSAHTLKGRPHSPHTSIQHLWSLFFIQLFQT